MPRPKSAWFRVELFSSKSYSLFSPNSYPRKSVFLLFQKMFFPLAKQPGLLCILLVLSLSFACQTRSASDTNKSATLPPEVSDAVTRGANQLVLRHLDDEWSKAAGAKDLEKTVSFYTDDAMVMPQNSPVIQGKDAIRAMWKGMFAVPGFGGGWKATKVEVAQSGDLGWTTGPYEITEVDANGKPMTDKGKYLAVWKKQADGSWKCVADMFNTDLPPASAPPALKSN